MYILVLVIVLFAGVIIGIYGSYVHYSRVCAYLEQGYDKYAEMANVMELIAMKLIRGEKISDGLRENKHVAVYGAGRVGCLLIRQLKRENVKIDFCIDRNAESAIKDSIPVYDPESVFPEADIIIVTPTSGTEEIISFLEKRSDASIVAVDDFLQNIW